MACLFDERSNYRVEPAVPVRGTDFYDFVPGVQVGIKSWAGTRTVAYKITPHHGRAWVGGFVKGAGGVDGVFATPNPNALCVVVKGEGYVVNVLEPSDFESVPTKPIVSILPIPKHDLLVFVSHTDLSAFDAKGLRWVTDRLSWDGIEELEVGATHIRGKAWDSPANRSVSFSVDLLTGHVSGGSSPEAYIDRGGK